MVISSSVLFHFTKNLENLINILTNEFVPRFCLENYSNLFNDSEEEFKIAFPMTCFCDLPLSQLVEHLKFYGNYGIGMRKKWGIDNGINPVLYMHPNSQLSVYVTTLFEYVCSTGEKEMNAVKSILNLIHHVKLYEGTVMKNDIRIDKRFYDEKEWRWVPSFDESLFENSKNLLPLCTEYLGRSEK